MLCFLSPTAIIMFTVFILQQATVKPPNIIAHEKGFKFYEQPQTMAHNVFIGDALYIYLLFQSIKEHVEVSITIRSKTK